MSRVYYEDPQTGRLYRQEGNSFFPADEVAEDTGPIEAAAVAFQSALRRMGRGAEMRAGQITGSNELYYGARERQLEEDRALAGLRAEHPIASMAGAVAPFLVAPAAGTGLAASAGTGAVLGALEPVPDPASSIYLGAGGGAAGWAAMTAGRAIAKSRAARGVPMEENVPLVTDQVGTAALTTQPGGLAARAQARIQQAANEARVRAGGAGPAVEAAESLDDLARTSGRVNADEAGSVAMGADPEIARLSRIRDLGYDPALLGGQALTRDPGEVHKWAVDVLNKAGFKLTLGQETGIKGLRQMEASWRSTPVASAPLIAIEEGNQRVFNKVVNRAIGQEGDYVTLEKINQAQEWVNKTFTKQAAAIDARGGVPAGGLDALNESIIADWAKSQIKIKDVISGYRRENATYSGEALLDARQRLNALIRDGKASGQTVRIEAYSDMIEAIDGAIAATARSQGGDIGRAREIYRVLRTLDRQGVWKNEQNVIMGPMYRALKQGFRNEMLGRKTGSPEVAELVNVIRAREAVLPEIVNDSGTATRMSMQTLLANPYKSVAEGMLGRGLAMAYVGLGKAGKRALSPQAGEQLSGIWGSTW